MFVRSLITGILAASELGPSKQFTRMQKPCALHFNAGVTAGLGSSRYRYAEEFYNAKSIFAYNAGLFLQMHIGKRITLQPEILYQADGSKSAEGNFRRQSICVPLNLHFNIVNESGGMFKFYPFAGGYFMHTFGGKNGGKEIDFDKEYNSQEWGFNLGMGMDVKKFQAKLYWQRGLSELSQNKAKDINTSAWFFSIGYIF